MKKNTTKNSAIKTDTVKTRNIVERRSEYRLQPEGFERRDFPAEAGTLNAVSRKSEVKRSSSAAGAAIELSPALMVFEN